MWYAILAYQENRHAPRTVAYHVATGLNAEEAYGEAERWAGLYLAPTTERDIITVVKPY